MGLRGAREGKGQVQTVSWELGEAERGETWGVIAAWVSEGTGWEGGEFEGN